MSRPQQRALFARFGDLGIRDRDQRLAEAARMLRIDHLGSFNDLSRDQASQLLDDLRDLISQRHTEPPF